MAKKSGKNKHRDGFQIVEPGPKLGPLDLEKARLESRDEGVSISLKYFRSQAECFSAWQSSELKKFSALIAKVKGYSAAQLMTHKPLCDRHKGQPAQDRFAWPDNLSEDLGRYELKVDSSNKARVHGAIIGSTFFLVWLDREHAVFPE